MFTCIIYIAYFSTRWRVNFSFLTFDLPIFQNSKLRRRKLYNFSLGYQIEMICNLLEDNSHNPSSTRLTDSTFSDFSANSLTFCCQESSSFMFSDVNIALTFGQKPEASYHSKVGWIFVRQLKTAFHMQRHFQIQRQIKLLKCRFTRFFSYKKVCKRVGAKPFLNFWTYWGWNFLSAFLI